MQQKGTIQVFAIIFAIVCLYSLSFTWFSSSVEKDAAEYANGDQEKERRYLDSMQSQVVYNLGITEYTYRQCKEHELPLGLDLKGGMNVTMEVSIPDLLRSLSNNTPDPDFNRALALANERHKVSQEDYITLFGKAFNEVASNSRLASPAIFGYTLKEKGVTNQSTNEEVINILRTEANNAIDQSFNVLRTRIDKFGVTQPNIQQLGTSGRILIELPGVKEPDRVRKLLQGTAQLEFWETYNNVEVIEKLQEANDVVRMVLEGSKADTSKADTAEAKTAEAKAETTNADTTKNPLLAKASTDSASTDTAKGLNAADQEKLRRENPLFSVLTPALTQDRRAADGPVIGFVLIRDTAKVNKYLSFPQVKQKFPRDCKFAWTGTAYDKDKTVLQLIALKGKDQPPLDGSAIKSARMELSQMNNKPEVSMTMDQEGAEVWRRLTKDNIGKSIAITLDGFVYSYPTVQGEIAGGRSSITGSFTVEEAKDLANKLEAGKLPAPARIVEEAIVGPSLGKESISAGLLSFIGSILVIIIFMVLYYNNAGFVANIALLANIFFIFGVLASLGAVLTLPGIAGIVFIIGVSVDANVLIFERIREELRKGSGLRLAIADGYSHAYASIIDSNVTSLLTGIILYIFGSGPIQGFATTTIIGICCSMFASIFISRIIYEAMLGRNMSIKFSMPWSANVLQGTKIDFVGKRRLFLFATWAIIGVGIVSMFLRGFTFGVDFKGGRSYTVKFDQVVEAETLARTLAPSFDNIAPQVKSFGGANTMKIITSYRIGDDSQTADTDVEKILRDNLDKLNGNKYEILTSQKVGPTVANDIKISAIWAILFSIVGIFVYILIRFRKWQFSLGATIALIHDVLMVLTAFTLLHGYVPFTLEIDQGFIAAILTVIGYSINDTVIVFDRIREYINERVVKNRSLEDTINEACNNTLSRTVITSLTAFLVLLVLFLFGGDTIKGFAFAMLIGVIVGTYSSIFVATPIVVEFGGGDKLLKK
jgi:SecD/SecF fusion protein